MNDRNRRSAAEVMANAARVVKAAVNIVRAAIAGGLHGAAAAAAKELLPTIIKFAVGVLIAIIVIPMFVISAMPNMFFGYETSEKDPQITMREQALSIGGAYLSLEDFEKTQQDAIITGEAAAYENQGVTIDEIRVSSKFDEEDLCWYIAINSVAHKQDLSEMKPEEVQSLLISNLKHTTRLESSGDQTVLRIIFQPLNKDKLMDDLAFDEDAKTWAGALFETIYESDVFTETTLSEFFGNMGNVQLSRLLLSCILSLVCLILAVFVQIILHEGGHLIFGLATGYRFVSFRVGSLTLIKEGGKFRFKRFSISGTGGQCLLSPPDKPYEQMPYFWYNAGGVLMNLLTGIIALILWISYPELPLPLHLFLLFSFICGFFLALMNGIPLKMSGITNDAYNLILMHRDLNTRKYLALQLAVNAEVQKGMRLKDMPDEWFPNDEVTDYKNIMQVAVKLLYISRYVDRKEFKTAQVLFSEIEQHKEEIVGLYVKEIECELLFLELIGERRQEEVERLYTDRTKRYIQRYKTMMSSKQRLLCALALYWENRPERAKEIYEKVVRKRDKYLLQGEVNSDLDIMETILREAQIQV